MKTVPWQNYKWLALSYPGIPLDHPEFVNIMCSLAVANIPTVIVPGPKGPIVVTWQRPANA